MRILLVPDDPVAVIPPPDGEPLIKGGPNAPHASTVELTPELEKLIECRPTGNPAKKGSGLGMPQSLYLQQFGDLLIPVFGEIPYHVGSSLTGGVWRDVDVRVMLNAERYAAMGLGDPAQPHHNERWCGYAMAFSELGRRMTGLPIDFQIQQTEKANQDYPDAPRSALILGALRRQERQ